MDELRDWATGLPPELTAKIAARLPCRTDRGKMAAVCREWRARAQVPVPPAALPWLLMPTADSTRVHCFLSDYHVHHHINEDPPHGARYFGSHDGAWLFVAFGQIHDHALINLQYHDGNIRIIPEEVECDGEVRDGMVILAATLSAPPDDPNCVGACIFTRWPDIPVLRRFAFWHMGSLTANDFMPDPEPLEPEPGWPSAADLEAEDIVFHGAAFHLLTRGEHIFEYQPALDVDEDGHVVLAAEAPLILNHFDTGGRNYDGLVVHARYLVASNLNPQLEPELLMVVRFTHPNQLMTSSFRVFRAIPPQDEVPHLGGGDEEEEDDQDAEEDDEGEEVDDQDEEEVEDQGGAVDDQGEEVDDQDAEEVEDQGGAMDDQGEEVDDQDAEEVEDQGGAVEDNLVGEVEVENPWSWEELDKLGGRMLFVGRGCSRSYSVANYPGLTAGVYFLDDRSFYDEEMIFGVNERQYPCGDNGKWSEGPPPVVIRCPAQNPSNHSPPTWLLP